MIPHLFLFFAYSSVQSVLSKATASVIMRISSYALSMSSAPARMALSIAISAAFSVSGSFGLTVESSHMSISICIICFSFFFAAGT